jgi:hypothetical protein
VVVVGPKKNVKTPRKKRRKAQILNNPIIHKKAPSDGGFLFTPYVLDLNLSM